MTMSVDLKALDVVLPSSRGMVRPVSLVYADDSGVHEKKFAGDTIGFSVALIPRTDGGYNSLILSPEQAGSMFTIMFFYEGHGLKCFDRLGHDVGVSGLDIYTYKVDWDCKSMLVMPALQPKQVENASSDGVDVSSLE